MKLQKRTFLLLEILVALSLMATLLSVLFSFLVQSMKVESKMDKARVALLERQSLQIRIQDVLTSLTSGGRAAPLYTQKFPKDEYSSLVALFDNGIDPEPTFSGAVIGRIYVDENHDLCLAYWPSESEEKEHIWRKETLFSNVSDLQFSFLNPDEKEHFQHTARPKVLWDRSWAKAKKEPPSMVRIVLKQNAATLEFAFRLPNSHPIPTYWNKGVKT